LRAFAFLILLACGPSGAAGFLRSDDKCPVGGCIDGGQNSIDPNVIKPEPLEPWDTTNAGPLSGIYAVEGVITAQAGPTVEIRQLLRLRIVQIGTHVHQKTTLCAFHLPDVPDTATLQIPAVLQNDVIQQKSTENEGDFLVMAAQVKYVPPPFSVAVGVSDPNGALPTRTDLSNAADEDHDGNPGVTLRAKTFTCNPEQLPWAQVPWHQLFVALKTSGSLSGAFSPAGDQISGKFDVKLAYNVLGWDDDCLSASSMLMIVIKPGSTFTAKRTTQDDDVDNDGNVSCSEIIYRAPIVFGQYWNN